MILILPLAGCVILLNDRGKFIPGNVTGPLGSAFVILPLFFSLHLFADIKTAGPLTYETLSLLKIGDLRIMLDLHIGNLECILATAITATTSLLLISRFGKGKGTVVSSGLILLATFFLLITILTKDLIVRGFLIDR